MNEQITRKLGRYHILNEIGKGGFATVYRARDPDLDREVALKVLDPLLTRDPVWVARFRREARAVARLDHPHVVTIYEVGEADGMLYIVNRLVEGGNLAARIREEGPLPWDEVVRLTAEIAAALDYAHDAGVVHRDLKAGNVLLDGERGAQLTDFGFASIVSESSFSVSISGGVVGTPQYIAPEVWEGQPATPQTDIYALGCIVYEMVVGKHLFQGDTTPSVMRAHFQPVELPEAWPEGVPPGLEAVLEKALAKEPEQRYARAGALAEAVGALREDRLAGPYVALQAAVAAKEWEQALELARAIQVEDADYRNVVLLEETALDGLDLSIRVREAVTWKAEAERALAEGDLRGAEMAARQWGTLLPEDAEVRAFLDRLAKAADSRWVSEPPLGPSGATVEPPSDRFSEPLARKAEVRPLVSQPAPARRRPLIPVWLWILGALAIVVMVVGVVVLLSFPAPLAEPVTQGPTAEPTPVPPTRTPTLALSASEAQATLTALGADGCSEYEDEDDFEGAAECLRLVTIAEPDNFWAYSNLARVYQILEEWDLSLEADEQGLEVATTPEEQVEVYLRMGVTYYQVGDYESAIDSLSTGRDIEQSVPANETNLLVWLARSYRGAGQTMEACWAFSEALTLAEEQSYTWAIEQAREGLEQCEPADVSTTTQPTLAGTPVPRPALPISADTANQVTELARWGKGTVQDATYSPDGKLLAVSSSLGTYLYDAQTLANVRLIEGARGPVFSPDGTLLAIWRPYEVYPDRLQLQQVNDGSLVSTVFTGWDSGPQAFSPDGTLIAVGLENAEVKIWRIADSSLLAVLDGQSDEGYTYSVAFSPNGELLACGSSDNLVRIWRIADGALLHTLEGHTDPVSDVTFSPTGKTLVSVSWDGTAKEWSVADGALVRSVVIDLPRSGVFQLYAVEFSPDGDKLAIAGGTDVQVLRADNWQSLYAIEAHRSNVWSISFSPDGQVLVTAAGDGTAQLSRASDGTHLQTLGGFMGSLGSMSLSTDGETVAAAGEASTVRLWNTWSGESRKTLPLSWSNAGSFALAPDAATFAVAYYDEVIRLRSAEDGALVQEFEGHINTVDTLAFSPDGTTLASGSYDTTARLWRVSDGTLLHTLEGHAEKVASVAFSPDGTTLATGSWDETVRLWRVSDGAVLQTLEGHDSWVESVAFSPDGEMVASAGSDGPRLWRVSDGSLLLTLPEGDRENYYYFEGPISFSPDGSVLAVAGQYLQEDGTMACVGLWRVSDGTLLGRLAGHSSSSYLEGMAFTPDGMLLITAAGDGTVRLWGVPAD